jgi:hypothetical protein
MPPHPKSGTKLGVRVRRGIAKVVSHEKFIACLAISIYVSPLCGALAAAAVALTATASSIYLSFDLRIHCGRKKLVKLVFIWENDAGVVA